MPNLYRYCGNVPTLSMLSRLWTPFMAILNEDVSGELTQYTRAEHI